MKNKILLKFYFWLGRILKPIKKNFKTYKFKYIKLKNFINNLSGKRSGNFKIYFDKKFPH